MIETTIQFVTENWMSLTTMMLTIIWLILEYKASMWLWPVGIILPIFWIIVSIEEKVYGNMIINSYYLITSIIGWIMWLRAKEGEDNSKITNISPKTLMLSIAILSFSCFIAFMLMWRYSGNNVYLCVMDSIATTMSFLGMIWLSKKWLQHWICWIVANTIYSVIFFIQGDKISTITFVISIIVSILGLGKWRQLMRENQ